MKNSSLETLLVLSKLGRILSKIAFICSIVGLSLASIGLISFALGFDGVKLGGVTIKGLIEENANMSMTAIYASTIGVIILCIGEIVLAYYAVKFFELCLKEKTPFSFRVSEDMKRLGILIIVIPFASLLLSAIFYGIMSAVTGEKADFNPSIEGSITLGIMFIITSIICKCGAERS